MRPASFLLAVVAAQITLGAFVVLTGKNEIVNTLHVATGAVVLGTSLFLTLRAFRVRLDQPVTAPLGPLSPSRPIKPQSNMKPDLVAYDKPQDAVASRSKLADVLVLAKVRVNALVVATTAGGYYMAGEAVDFGTLAAACFGTALVASGAAAVNQVTERDTDRLMERTRLRPVADGRMSAGEGWMIAGALSAVGLLMLVADHAMPSRWSSRSRRL